MVNSGWTIANRRAIAERLGNGNFEELADIVSKTNPNGEVLSYEEAVSHLSTQNIAQCRELLINRFQEKVCSVKSKTFSKLFSEEFKPHRKVTKEGYPVTTVIDKKTGKPVEVYFKQSPMSTVERLSGNSFEKKINVPQEEWIMYRRLPNGEEEKLGFINWTVQKDQNMFGSGFIGQEIEYLKHYEGTLAEDVESDYSGIGIRLNQLKIERFLQENLGQLEICSSGLAFPFHAKNGFKAVYKERTLPISIDDFVQKLKEKVPGLDADAIKASVEKHLVSCDKNSITISSRMADELYSLAYIKTGERRFGDLAMELPKESLDFWKTLIRMQPIF